MSKYCIGFCELYQPGFHDYNDNIRNYLLTDTKYMLNFTLDHETLESIDINNPNIDRYLINNEPIPLNYDSEDEDDTNDQFLYYPFSLLYSTRSAYNSHIMQNSNGGNHHNIRNIGEIFNSKLYIYPQILEEIILNTGESTCVIHTYKLAILQRRWKKYYSKLQEKINFMRNPKTLLKRQLGIIPRHL